MLAGERPSLPMAWAELEAKARESLDDRAIAYIFGGAGSEDTMRANLEAFRRWRIVPPVPRRDLSVRDLSLTMAVGGATTLPEIDSGLLRAI